MVVVVVVVISIAERDMILKTIRIVSIISIIGFIGIVVVIARGSGRDIDMHEMGVFLFDGRFLSYLLAILLIQPL